MSISSITETVINGFTATGKAIGQGALWLGRQVSLGFNNFVVPAISKIWDVTKLAGGFAFSFLRTGFGLGSVGLGITGGLIALTQHPTFAGDDKYYHRLALIGSAVAVAVLSGVALGYGSGAVI